MKQYNKLTDAEKTKILKQLYIKQKKSFADIAQQFNTYSNKIRRDAIKLNINIRDKSEAQKNALMSGKIKHPTKGKTRPDTTKEKIGFGVMKSWENLSDKELNRRKKLAKQSWDNMDENQKESILRSANEAVRQSSKTGSKLEKFLLTELINRGHKVDFHKEHNLLNTKLQIDLFLPKLNIAIEVDGPSHFLPVWGEDVLTRNIKYDNKKTGLLLGKGCAIIRIKQTKDFSPSRARQVVQKLLEQIEFISKKFPDTKNRIIEIGD